MMLLAAIYFFIFLTALVLTYALFLRAWLKTQPWALGFMDFIEPAEIFLYKKSETILVGRFLIIIGLIPPIIAIVDPYTLQGIAYAFNADKIAPYIPLAFTGLGWAVEKLRKNTSMSLEDVEKPRDEGGN